MRIAHLLALALALCLTPGCAGEREPAKTDHPAEDTHAVHWGYGEDDGPRHWGSLNADWALCASGTEQSPIDIRTAGEYPDADSPALDLPAVGVRIIRQEHVWEVLDNGHTIQVNVDAGSSLTVGDQTFDLQQYHFHAPSEHTVDGEYYAMEMHLVHASATGGLAVIGVFIEEGGHNVAFEPVWGNLPTEQGTEVRVENVGVNVDDMLPSDMTSWRYDGSLTTPPCSEGVRWFVLKTPIQLSAEQIQRFQARYTGNNRPTLQLHGRSITTDSPTAVR
jgi:carbonic anhydrase